MNPPPKGDAPHAWQVWRWVNPSNKGYDASMPAEKRNPPPPVWWR